MKSLIFIKKYFKDGKLLTGFSLIEMVVVIAIMIIFITITAASFSEARGQLALTRAAHQLMQDIRRAQEMAMSSIELSGEGSCALPAKGYGVYIDIQNSGADTLYRLYADTHSDCGDPEGCNCEVEDCYGWWSPQDCIVETVVIREKEVYLKKIENTGPQKVSINFKPPNPNTNIKWLKEEKNEVMVVLALKSDPLKTKTVVINRAGLIQVK